MATKSKAGAAKGTRSQQLRAIGIEAAKLIRSADVALRDLLSTITNSKERAAVGAACVEQWFTIDKVLVSHGKNAGKPASRKTLAKQFERACTRAGLDWTSRQAGANEAKGAEAEAQAEADAEVGGGAGAKVTGLSEAQKTAMLIRAIGHVAQAQQVPPADLTAWLGEHLAILTTPAPKSKGKKAPVSIDSII